jgi:ABC-type sugar transport system ATPase subunit
MAEVRLSRLAKSFGKEEVIPPLNLTIAAGEFAVLVGPSGCGKSTLLRMIAGLEEPSAGQVHIGGRDVTGEEPSARGLAMVFQSYALYPHMSVAQNMEFGLEMAGMDKAARRAEVEKAARLLKLEPYLDRKPRALSGGQRQRVAIGRAIVRQPHVFLFDEPLSNLDAELRVEMRLELAKLHAQVGATMIYVTHDQVEAMTMADRIVVLRAGRVEQQGAPEVLYADPDTAFVAGFLGVPRMNLLDCTITRVEERRAVVDIPTLGLNGLSVPLRHEGATPGPATFGLRPEAFGPPRAGTDVTLRAEVIENMGPVRYIYTATERANAVVAEVPRGTEAATGGTLGASIAEGAGLLFSESGARL